MRVVLESHRRGRGPLRMLLRDAFLGDARKPQLLTLPQLRDERALALGIVNDGRANPLVRAHGVDNEIAGVNLHDLARGGALGVEGELDAAVFAILLAVAVARVEHLVGALGVEGDQTQAVGDELVGKHAAILFDFDEVDRDRWDFGEDDAAEGVREGKVDAGEIEVDMIVIRLASSKRVRNRKHHGQHARAFWRVLPL